MIFQKMCGLLAVVPQASKNHLAKKRLRDPFELFYLPTGSALSEHKGQAYLLGRVLTSSIDLAQKMATDVPRGLHETQKQQRILLLANPARRGKIEAGNKGERGQIENTTTPRYAFVFRL